VVCSRGQKPSLISGAFTGDVTANDQSQAQAEILYQGQLEQSKLVCNLLGQQ
jgi:hypothetical protein